MLNILKYPILHILTFYFIRNEKMNKLILIIAFFLISNYSLSQNDLKKCPSVSPEIQHLFDNKIIKIDNDYLNDNFNDLMFLKEIIGDKRFVLLGESSHYVEEYSKIKYRLIKFLHKEMDFDVILFESDFFNCNTSYEISDRLSTTEFLNNSIFDLWHTKVNYKLFEYIEETKKTSKPLFFSGFDIRKSNITDNQILYAYYKNILKRNDYKEFIALDTMINNFFRDVILFKNKKAFNNSLLIELSNRINILQNNTKNYQNIIIRKTFQRIIDNKRCLLNIIDKARDDAQKYNAMRDKCMAENIEWIANILYPKKKIIIWAHNTHIKNNDEFGKYENETPSMGYYLPESIKNNAYTIGIFGLKGSWGYKDEIHKENNLKKNSLEALICRTNNEISFIDIDTVFEISDTEKIYLWEQKKSIERIKKEYDGLLFIRNISPARYFKSNN